MDVSVSFIAERVAKILDNCERRGLRDVVNIRSALKAEFSNYGADEYFAEGEQRGGSVMVLSQQPEPTEQELDEFRTQLDHDEQFNGGVK